MDILDQCDDYSGQQLYRLLKVCDPPEFVKEASSEDIYGPEEGLPAHNYADPVRRKFPCHTPAATWVSTAFYLDNEAEMNEKIASWIRERLSTWTARHEIRVPVYQLIEKHAAHNADLNIELKDNDFALVIHHEDGEKERHYPLRNAKEVQKAAEYLKTYRDDLVYRHRQQMAERILEKASAYGVDLRNYDDFLEKQAGYGSCSAEHVAGLLWDRVQRIGLTSKPNDLQIELAKMAELCGRETGKIHEPETLQKVAEIIDSVDRQTGLAREYGSGSIERPEEILFTVTRKSASQSLLEHCSMQSGNIYKVSDFTKVQLGDLRDILGDEFADTVSFGGQEVAPQKLAEIAATLPRPDAALLDRIFSAAGIVPIEKEAAHQELGFTQEQWKELAKHHAHD